MIPKYSISITNKEQESLFECSATLPIWTAHLREKFHFKTIAVTSHDGEFFPNVILDETVSRFLLDCCGKECNITKKGDIAMLLEGKCSFFEQVTGNFYSQPLSLL
jgi:hypothetical protein